MRTSLLFAAAACAALIAAADAPDAIEYFIDLPDHCGHGMRGAANGR